VNIQENDTLLSFDVVSLFAMIPIDEAVAVIQKVTNQKIAMLLKICLKSTFFSFQGTIDKQMCGIALGSPLSPILGNLFMEHFEVLAISCFTLKPKWCSRYVDDTNVNW
jgi:hypothetical protein